VGDFLNKIMNVLDDIQNDLKNFYRVLYKLYPEIKGYVTHTLNSGRDMNRYFIYESNSIPYQFDGKSITHSIMFECPWKFHKEINVVFKLGIMDIIDYRRNDFCLVTSPNDEPKIRITIKIVERG
jgi:hypothetical protein